MESFDDNIHGLILIPEHIRPIIQTEEFQRLKKIKQLSLIDKKTTRFEHCIGTYHLANKALDALQKNTEGLEIPNFYRNCVTIAALLHDIGHGPFSHFWEFICDDKYRHEQNAGACVDEIFKIYESDWLKDPPCDPIDLIKGFITGESNCLKDKHFLFLFDIVNNKHCGLDVDKWDYLCRDYEEIKTSDLDLKLNMDFEDVFMRAHVSDDRARIKHRYCDFQKIYDIFEARSTFHIYFYRKASWMCLEQIFKRIIELENQLRGLKKQPKINIDGIEIQKIRSTNREAFLKLYDDEIWRILKHLDSSDEITTLFKCLESRSITEVFPATDKEKSNIPEFLTVKRKIARAGEEMRGKKFLFYGDENEKNTNKPQEMGCFEEISYFEIITNGI